MGEFVQNKTLTIENTTIFSCIRYAKGKEFISRSKTMNNKKLRRKHGITIDLAYLHNCMTNSHGTNTSGYVPEFVEKQLGLRNTPPVDCKTCNGL